MACESCYSGCVETTTDKCVRYTGNDALVLGIETGDPLLTVEQALIDHVISFLNGTGITITLNPSYYCTLVSQYLEPGDPNVVELFGALVRAACDLQTQIDTIDGTLATLNADYTIDCLDGVTASSDTHAVLQAVINKVCENTLAIDALALDIDTNYVKLADVNDLIAAYLAEHSGGSTQFNSRMVPYTVVEYYGSLSNFDGTGAGIAANGYDKIYLCNGANGTPDKRGRVGVGAIASVPGPPLDAAVDPTFAGNPNYALNGVQGGNSVTLTLSQIPNHTHTATTVTTVTEDNHTHFIASAGTNTGSGAPSLSISGTMQQSFDDGGNLGYRAVNSTAAPAAVGLTSPTKTNLAVSVDVTNTYEGGSGAHSNIQPVLACYYIMYIP